MYKLCFAVISVVAYPILYDALDKVTRFSNTCVYAKFCRKRVSLTQPIGYVFKQVHKLNHLSYENKIMTIK